MVCIVSGLPSNIAALQLEWALTNPHLTRHIDPSKRISFSVTQIKTNRKTGKTRRKPGRPTTSILEKLSNLHLLLRSPYFSQWPLKLQFFSEDVFQAWQSWCERVDEQLHPSIEVVLDLAEPREPEVDDITSGQRPKKRRKVDLIGRGGVDGIDPTYSGLQDVLQKGQFLLDEGDGQNCAVCSETLDPVIDLYTVCPHGPCHSLSHVRCLAQHFFALQDTAGIVPKTGKCPSCQGPLDWLTLMREVSVRTRNPKEVAKILKKRQKLLSKQDVLESDSEDDLEPDEAHEAELEEDHLEEDVDDDARSEVSMLSLSSDGSKAVLSPTLNRRRDEIVIEDSDDDR